MTIMFCTNKALTEGVASPKFQELPFLEQGRLHTQAHLMIAYSAVLGARIAALGEES